MGGNLLSYYSDAEGPGDWGSGFFIAEEGDGVGDKWSGNNTSVYVETLLVAFLEDFHTFSVAKVSDFWRISIQIKGILLYVETLK